MANEVSLSVSLTVAKGAYAYKRALSDQFDMTNGRGGNPGVVTVTTGGVTISFGSLTAPKWVMLLNLDADNFVDVGPDSSGLVGFVRLEPGEFAVFPLKPGITVKAIADTASVDLLVEAQDT